MDSQSKEAQGQGVKKLAKQHLTKKQGVEGGQALRRAQHLTNPSNSAAVAAGVSSQIRAAHGRWKAVETPDQSYTFVHQGEMVALATTMLQPRL